MESYPGSVNADTQELMQCGNLIDCGMWFPVNLFAIFDPDGKKHLPRVCWKCQGIELEPWVVSERNEYESYLRKQEEAAQAQVEKELAAKAAKEALKNPGAAPATPATGREKGKAEGSAGKVDTPAAQSRTGKRRRGSTDASTAEPES